MIYRAEKYRHSFKGVMTNLYGNIKARQIKRHNKDMHFTKDEFIIWFLQQPNAKFILLNWKLSNYNRLFSASVDRLNDYDDYNFSNMRLTIFKDNHAKGMSDMRNGINNKQSKAVIGINKLTGDTIEFYSAKNASIYLKCNRTNIVNALKKPHQTAKGFYFKYK